MLPPDLHEPFASREDRAHAASQLIERYQVLEALERLAALPPDLWPPEQVERFPPSIAGHWEHAADRLAQAQDQLSGYPAVSAMPRSVRRRA
jgi:hypothetical protein